MLTCFTCASPTVPTSCIIWSSAARNWGGIKACHCEEQSDEATSSHRPCVRLPAGDCFASLAMTIGVLVLRRAAGCQKLFGSFSTCVASWLNIRFVLIGARSEEHTSELQSLMRISYAVFCLKKKKTRELSQLHHMK